MGSDVNLLDPIHFEGERVKKSAWLEEMADAMVAMMQPDIMGRSAIHRISFTEKPVVAVGKLYSNCPNSNQQETHQHEARLSIHRG